MNPVIARYLPDFSCDLPPASEAPDRARNVPVRAPAPAPASAPGQALTSPWSHLRRPGSTAPAPEPEEDRTALIEAAEARGRRRGAAEAQAEAKAEADMRIEAERAAFEARFAAARRAWSEREAEALASGFAAALRSLDAELTDRIARLLVPVLTDALRRRAVAELGAALTRLLSDPQHAAIRVAGPADLLAALAARLGPLADSVAFAPGETTEVSVSADQAVIETQLTAWTRLLAAAVAET